MGSQAGAWEPAKLGWMRCNSVIAVSFRANGNLLSQWRSYSALGKGVSIGFDPDTLSATLKFR